MRTKTKTRFSPADLKALRAEVEAVRGSLLKLSDHLLSANRAHTGNGFYDSDVRTISDRLCRKLNQIDGLLYRENARHNLAAEEMTA